MLTASVAGVCLISHLALQLKSSIEPPNMALWRERWPVKSVQSAGASICNAPWSKIPLMGFGLICALRILAFFSDESVSQFVLSVTVSAIGMKWFESLRLNIQFAS